MRWHTLISPICISTYIYICDVFFNKCAIRRNAITDEEKLNIDDVESSKHTAVREVVGAGDDRFPRTTDRSN